MSDTTPVLTVGLPLWKADKIVWLALESLCRQEGAPPWELVVCEERHAEAVGWEGVEPYRDRLADAGCTNIIMATPGEWVPLSNKWSMIAQAAHPESRAMVLHAADCYSAPSRLAATTHLHAAGYGWVQQHTGHFYDTATKRLTRFDMSHPLYTHATGLNMSCVLPPLREMPLMGAKSGVDMVLFSYVRTKLDMRVGWLPDTERSLDTHGHNQISATSGAMMAELEPPFVEATAALRDVVPWDIAARLEGLL